MALPVSQLWVNSRSWWWTGRPGMLRFMGSQRVGHDWATELNWTEPKTWLTLVNAPSHSSFLRKVEYLFSVLLQTQIYLGLSKTSDHVLLFSAPWTVARQAPCPLGFSRQLYWSGLPCPSPGCGSQIFSNVKWGHYNHHTGLLGGLIKLIRIEYESGTWCRRRAHWVLLTFTPSWTSFCFSSCLFLQIIIYYQKTAKCT